MFIGDQTAALAHSSRTVLAACAARAGAVADRVASVDSVPHRWNRSERRFRVTAGDHSPASARAPGEALTQRLIR